MINIKPYNKISNLKYAIQVRVATALKKTIKKAALQTRAAFLVSSSTIILAELDHLFKSPQKGQITVTVQLPHVSGMYPAVAQSRNSFFRLAPVPLEISRT